jgi:hypothetical protein
MTKKSLQYKEETKLLRKVEEDLKRWPKWFLANAELVLETGSLSNGVKESKCKNPLSSRRMK